MLTFNVGPSKLSLNTKEDIKKAADQGILEISHRSEKFTEISEKTIKGLREFFNIPKNYKIFYTNSATEAMQLSITNTCEKKSFHFINGNFSRLFSKISNSLGKEIIIDEVENGKQNNFENVIIPNDCDLITLPHNETSTGVMCQVEDIKKIKEKNPDAILIVDITSSAGATPIAVKEADIWFYSVQKCFGLPAGLGIMFVSPRAWEKSIELSEKKLNLSGNFNLENMWKKMAEKYQTICTPNVLNIFLLGEKLDRWNKDSGLEKKINDTKEKYEMIKNITSKNDNLDFFVEEEKYQSLTTVCLKSNEIFVKKIHEICAEQNIILGKGYGPLKKSAIRIANFPSVTKEDLKRLENIIESI